MAPRPATHWKSAGGAALVIFAVALYLDLCARPERPKTAAGSRASSAVLAEPAAPAPAERTDEADPQPRGEDRGPTAAAPPPAEDPGVLPDITLKDVLAAALAKDFPELSLSEGEVTELGATLAELEQAVRGIRGLEQNAADAEALREFQARRDQALADFERIAGMSLTEFLRRAPSAGGIDSGEDNDEEIVLEPISPRQPEPAR